MDPNPCIGRRHLNIKCHENPFSCSQVVRCGEMNGQTNMVKVRDAFWKLLVANTPKY
jgi:hypothetical protein